MFDVRQHVNADVHRTSNFAHTKECLFLLRKNNSMHTILITGGAGFIGSHLTRLFVTKYPQYSIINLDKLTYAGNLENLKDIEVHSNYHFVKGDITDLALLRSLFNQHRFTAVLHCAAESHVDRSITDPLEFISTNVLGTSALLQSAKEFWAGDHNNKIFYHISTDEVYGSLGKEGFFTEESSMCDHYALIIFALIGGIIMFVINLIKLFDSSE